MGWPAITVAQLIKERISSSLKLAFVSIFISVLLGIPLGILSAVKRDTFWDFFGKVIAVLGQSMPVFWLGIVLIQVFGVNLNILPVSGAEGVTSYILPAICVGWFNSAGVLRLTRSGMIEVLDGLEPGQKVIVK